MDFSVMQPNKLIRAHSRSQIWANYKELLIAMLVVFLINSPNFIFSLLEKMGTDYYYQSIFPNLGDVSFTEGIIVFGVITAFLSGAFTFGLVSYFLKVVRGEAFGKMNLFDGLINGFNKILTYFRLNFMISLFIFLWLMAFFIPLFLIFFGISMVGLEANTSYGNTFAFAALGTGMMAVLFAFSGGMLIASIPAYIKSLNYRLAFYIIYDNPNMGVMDAINESKKMMTGNKMKLFLLDLSFLGWLILGLAPSALADHYSRYFLSLILMIGGLYLVFMPYFYLANANFYENLKTSGGAVPVPVQNNDIEETPDGTRIEN